ncbi:MAG: 4-hydroxy-tetrahydrodipicolinate synthase [Gammaproteobacteria bacterium]|nr:4-hydroxy-tetrahydrodipicolinate synthase [Gammaproteobacteria bacterium]MYF27886.1 4-hydroxy-tetrahydrodipicolinate synthase [Gammaproteobacteria bacterium]MYK47008.1 4-hydroxy-tetrahydrodipicolinate synthase [Gammaproteobacteria bacterium]
MTGHNKRLQGSLVALVTPMKNSGAVDWAALDALVDWHLESGTHGIVPVGTTGESATLNHDEHKRVIKAVIGRVDGRVPVVAGAGANATAEAIELTESAQGDGADYCLSVTPYYNKPTQEGLYRHYCAIAEAVDLPMVLYNVPPRTACDMKAETVARLAGVDSIVGIKEACGDAERVAEIKALVPDDFVLLSGEDAQTLTMVGYGAVGAISVTANVLPALMVAFCEAFLAGDHAKAREIDARLQPIHEILFVETSPIPSKWALNAMGRIEDGIRLPLVELTAPAQVEVRKRLEALTGAAL